MPSRNERVATLVVVLDKTITEMIIMYAMFVHMICTLGQHRESGKVMPLYRSVGRLHDQASHLHRMIGESDRTCVEQLRVDRHTFVVLCNLVRDVGGLVNTRFVKVEEMVAMFLSVLGHDDKNRPVKFDFIRSGETVSRHFNNVLNAVLKLRRLLLHTPKPVSEDSVDPKWKWFKNCVGALDGTHMRARVPLATQARYRTRKGGIATNVLGVCSLDMRIIYVLPGWEGSAADSRVLKDAVSRRHGLKVERGTYYLVDAGYTNAEGFLAPFRGQRYHLKEFGNGAAAPRNAEEYFNLKHATARTIIERCFCLLKNRWAIIRNGSHYPVTTHNRIIAACCLLHNLIRNEMPFDPVENELPEYVEHEEHDEHDVIDTIETSIEWTGYRNQLAIEMYNQWRSRRGRRSRRRIA